MSTTSQSGLMGLLQKHYDIAATVFAVLFIGLILFASRTPQSSAPQNVSQSGTQVAEPKAVARSEFTELVLSKRLEEVLATAGRPDTTQESGNTQYWYYNQRTFDPITGKIDRHAQVVARFGTVESVNY